MIIPSIDNPAAKNQHQVPRTYMKKWCRTGDQVTIFDKNKQKYEPKNIETINSQNYFYDFLPGEFMPEAALSAIYGFMQDCTVEYVNEEQSRTATTFEEYNTAYNYKDTWNVVDADGHTLTRKERNQLLTYIGQSRYSFSEEEWSKQYENQWESFIDNLEEKLRAIKRQGGPSTDCSVTVDDFTLLFKYLIIYDWRNATGNSLVNDVIDWLLGFMDVSSEPIPFDERIHPDDRTVVDEIRHGFMRQTVYKFLHGDPNSMDIYWKSYQEHLTFVFYLADKMHPFITSDQPSVLIESSNGTKEHILVATPTLLVSTAKKDEPRKYCIFYADEDAVKSYNQRIYEQSNVVILPDGIESVESFYD